MPGSIELSISWNKTIKRPLKKNKSIAITSFHPSEFNIKKPLQVFISKSKSIKKKSKNSGKKMILRSGDSRWPFKNPESKRKLIYKKSIFNSMKKIKKSILSTQRIRHSWKFQSIYSNIKPDGTNFSVISELNNSKNWKYKEIIFW